MTSNNKKTIKSAHTTLDILEELVRRDEPNGAEIAANLDYSRSAIHYHLNTLQQRKYVVYEDGYYRLGLKFLELGEAALVETALYPHVDRAVKRLNEDTGMFARVMALELGAGAYIVQAGEPPETIPDYRIGKEVSLDVNAFGKAILAFLPEDELLRFLRGDEEGEGVTLEHFGDTELFRQLSTITQRKLAFDDGERRDGVRNIASPILVDGDVIGSIGVTSASIEPDAMQGRLKARRFAEEEPEIVKGVARDLGERIEDHLAGR